MTTLAIREALQALEDREGRLRPEQVVEAARPKNSPLHAYFTWDNSIAAHKYRLDQAGILIRTVRVEVQTEHTIVKVSGYVRDPDIAPRIAGYRSLARVKQDPDLSRAAVAEEFIRAASHLKRARELASVLVEVTEIDELLDRLGILQSSLERPGHQEGHA